MKFLMAAFIAILPQTLLASAKIVTINLKEESINKTSKLCIYKGNISLGNSQSMKPYQLFIEGSPGVFEKIDLYAILRTADDEFFISPSSVITTALTSTCAPSIQYLFVQ